MLNGQSYIHDLGVLTHTVFTGVGKTKSFISSTNNGQLQSLLYPYSDGGYNNLKVHKGSITKIVLTKDNKLLFSAGEDGSLFILRVSEEKIPSKKDLEEICKPAAKTFTAIVQADEDDKAES